IFNGKSIEEKGKFFHRKGETSTEHYLRRFTIRPPKGENWVDVQKRVHNFMEDVERKYKGKRILFVSHGLVLDLIPQLMDGVSRKDFAENWRKTRIHTGEWYKISYTQLPYNEDMEIDMHRPYIDEVNFACAECKEGKMKRVKEVVDVWFDSGAMPFAQNYYPFEKILLFPADYIVY
ncbi:histidine phosphatase family protein, partial [Patescibacteria group bacterium]|nr:histidine phosphatase family protein [Patescibacteria group bacterium]